MSVCLILPDVRQLPSTTLMVYPHEFLHTFPQCLEQAHFLWPLIRPCSSLFVWATLRFCLALASQAHHRHPSSLLQSISQTQSLWPHRCTTQGSVTHHEFFQQLWQQHLNKTGWSEMFCKITYRKDIVYLQGKQCHLWSQTNCLETPQSSILNTVKALQCSLQILRSLWLVWTNTEMLTFQANCSWILCLALSNTTFKRFP